MRYAITDLSGLFAGRGSSAAEERRGRWLEDLRRWMGDGIDFVQLREKRLDAGDAFSLARAAAEFLQGTAEEWAPVQRRPRLLVNGRPDIAAAAGADGVHLPARAGELTPAEVRRVFAGAGLPGCFVSVSCHTEREVVAARRAEADLILFGPVFEKRVGGNVVSGGRALGALRKACEIAGAVPVLALGGVTAANAESCRQAGAAGVAGIRLFSA